MTSHARVVADITARLNHLGGTPGAVAATLSAEETAGTRYLPGRCPISRYLKCHLPRGWSATVSPSVARIYPPFPWARPIPVTLPAPVAAFVLAFDGHAYPELERVA